MKLIAICRTTFIETIRQPVYSVLLWAAFGWVAFVSPSLATFSLESGGDIKVMKEVSLATMLLYGLLAAVFSATSVITREIESHTVLTVISKPVARSTFLCGKYLGVTGAVLLGYLLLSYALILTNRHGTMETAADKFDGPVWILAGLALLVSLVAVAFGNYVYGWNFLATLLLWVITLMTIAVFAILFISPEWTLQHPHKSFDLQLLYAQAAAFFGVLVLTAFAVAVSTRFSQVITLILCVGAYIFGLLADHYLGRAAATDGLANGFYHVVPNFQFFWLGGAVTEGLQATGAHIAQLAGYTAAMCLALLALGVAMFETREIS